jgi:hypothetical protein
MSRFGILLQYSELWGHIQSPTQWIVGGSPPRGKVAGAQSWLLASI